MRLYELFEGGWASTLTQDTKITPQMVGKAVDSINSFIAAFNAFLSNKSMPPVKQGHPVGSSNYWQRDLRLNPNKEYGDMDYLFFIPRLPDTTDAKNSSIYVELVKEFLAGRKDIQTENGQNLILKMDEGYMQIDLVHGYYENKEWLRALVPEYNVKGVISASLYSSLAELLDLSIGSYGVQAKLKGNIPVSFRQSKDVQLVNISKDPSNWARDTVAWFYKMAGGRGDPTIPAALAQAPGVNADEMKVADIAAAIKGIAVGLEANGLFGKLNLTKISNAEDMLSKINSIYASKMQAKINDPKFNKAQTLAAKQKVEDTRAKLAKAIDWVASLLNG